MKLNGQRKRTAPYYAILAAYGVEIVEQRHGKHTHVTGRYKGHPVICTIPLSPSDCRGIHRFRSNIKNAVEAINKNCP